MRLWKLLRIILLIDWSGVYYFPTEKLKLVRRENVQNQGKKPYLSRGLKFAYWDL